MSFSRSINELSKKIEILNTAKKIIRQEKILQESLNVSEKDDPWEDIGYKKNVITINPSMKRTRINLNVPYNQRESAKRVGAKWDAGVRKWYMLVTNDELKKIPNAWR